MNLYDTVLGKLIERKKNKEQGKFNGIPHPFSKYKDYMPSFEKGTYIGYMGATGSGKSRTVRYIHVYKTIEFSMQHNYPVKILYFALEDNKEQVMKKIFAHYLWERHKINVPAKVLDSVDAPLPDMYLSLITQDKEFYTEFLKDVVIINDATNPDQIFNYCKKVYESVGQTHHITAIIDNYNNITKCNRHMNDWEAIKELSREKIRLQLCKEMNFTVIGILQQDMESEKQTARNVGKGQISTLEPNIGSIGTNKAIATDFFYIFALFSPWRYEIKDYFGYNCECLRNKLRVLLCLKSNEGEIAPRLPLYFEGGKEVLNELPAANSEEINRLYQKILEDEQKRRENFDKKNLFS